MHGGVSSPSFFAFIHRVARAGRGSNRGGLRGPCYALGGRQCGWELTESAPGAGIVSCRGGGGGPSYALGGCHCGWESPFRVLLGPPGSASSGRSGNLLLDIGLVYFKFSLIHDYKHDAITLLVFSGGLPRDWNHPAPWQVILRNQ